MAQRTGRSWQPYSHLLLIPLTLVGLDSFGWLFTQPGPTNSPTGLWPRRLPANTPYPLSLYLPPHAPVPSQLEISGAGLPQPQRVSANVKDRQWQVTLPALPAGAYQLRLLSQDEPIGPDYSLLLDSAPTRRLRLDRALHTPGDWLVVSLQQTVAVTQPLRLEVLGPGNEHLGEQFIPKAAGLWPTRVRLPEGLTAGSGRILLWQGTQLLEQTGFKIIMPGSTSSLQLIPHRSQLLPGISQEVRLTLLDGAGLPVEGWIRIGNETLPVRKGQATLKLSPEQIRDTYSFNAGDSRGNLLQDQLRFKLAADWLPERNANGSLAILAHEAQHLSWILGAGKRVLASGQQAVIAGSTQLNLPGQLPDQGPLWLELCDPSSRCQQLRWLSEPAAVSWSLKPDKPHALSPLRVTPAAGLNGQLEVFRLQQQGSSQILPEPGDPRGLFQPIGLHQPVPEQPFWLTLWTLLGAFVVSLPLLSLWRNQQQRPRPFPNASQRKRSLRLQQLCLCVSGFGLAALMIGDLAGPLPASLFGGLGLITLAASSLILRPWLSKEHPMFAFLPAIHALLMGLLTWFLWFYQPGTLPAVWLGLGLSGLLLSNLAQSLVPIRLELPRQISLAALGVASLVQAVLPLRAIQPVPTWRESADPPVWSLPSLQPLGRLLDHQLLPASSGQILQPPRRSGPQQLLWRHWTETEPISYQQSLSVGPAVLAEFEPPAFAQLGDRFELPIRLLNETAQTQETAWHIDDLPSQTQTLTPRSLTRLNQLFEPTRSGWQSLRLEHRYNGQWYAQTRRLFVQIPPRPEQDPRLHLEVELPQSSGLVPGEEIPVLVRLRQSSGRSMALGLQIGLPAGFTALTDTLSDRRNRSWLSQAEIKPGSLNITTGALTSGQDISFHFRLRAQIPGSMQMPAARLFFLERPEWQSVLGNLPRLDVKADNQ